MFFSINSFNSKFSLIFPNLFKIFSNLLLSLLGNLEVYDISAAILGWILFLLK